MCRREEGRKACEEKDYWTAVVVAVVDTSDLFNLPFYSLPFPSMINAFLCSPAQDNLPFKA